MNKIRREKFLPLIVVLMLICIIPTIMLVGAHNVRPSETAELNKNIEQQEEQISAETKTVQAGDTYTVPTTGIYKIELHGGKAADIVTSSGTISGYKGCKVAGYVKLRSGVLLDTQDLSAGSGAPIPESRVSTAGMGGSTIRLSMRRICVGWGCWWSRGRYNSRWGQSVRVYGLRRVSGWGSRWVFGVPYI